MSECTLTKDDIKRIPFTLYDAGWVILCIGMAIGAGIVFFTYPDWNKRHLGFYSVYHNRLSWYLSPSGYLFENFVEDRRCKGLYKHYFSIFRP